MNPPPTHRPLPAHLAIPSLAAIGVHAFVTTRAAGSFGLPEQGEDAAATARWHALQQALVPAGAPRLASARQVHGTRVLVHAGAWEGWVRVDGADGHLLTEGGAAAVTIADCVPVFVAHPSGVVAVVHAGWRGVAGGILPETFRAFAARGLPGDELVVHLGPSICGRCYEVGETVYEQLTGWSTTRPRNVDLRALLAEQSKQFGVTRWTASGECTKCDNDLLFSHRAGDAGRQVAVIVAPRPHP
ncbi:MAG: polyphenol oxidase family protein [Gemmatimonadetes bacterium]|nr:polyphenol oxidase family protein [Gemmatimonadota bacterium]